MVRKRRILIVGFFNCIQVGFRKKYEKAGQKARRQEARPYIQLFITSVPSDVSYKIQHVTKKGEIRVSVPCDLG